MFILIVEDDAFRRLLQVILDARASPERSAAFAHMIAHEFADFAGWCAQLRQRLPGLCPADVRLVSSQEELRANLPDASAVVVDSLTIGPAELAIAKRLRVVQKYGTITANIDTEACAERKIKVLTLRRRANTTCAEHAFAMLLMFARQLHRVKGCITIEQLTAAGYLPTTFDGRHVPTSGWARVTGLMTLRDSTLGILGMGEIGRELATRAAAFEMRVIYYQRNRLTLAEEQRFQAQYASLETLLAVSEWVSIHLPETETTRNFIGRPQFSAMKRGAFVINVSRARIVERDALIEALESGHLGGYGLDTHYDEPGRADDPLFRFNNVILTPHTAGQPRFNGFMDFETMLVGLERALAE